VDFERKTELNVVVITRLENVEPRKFALLAELKDCGNDSSTEMGKLSNKLGWMLAAKNRRRQGRLRNEA